MFVIIGKGDTMLIDTHVHLNADQFENNRESIIQNALDAGVTKMIVIGFDHTTNQKAIELAHQYDFLYATVGFHPTSAKDIKKQDFDTLERQIQDERVVGIGECGLDFYWDKTHKQEQIEVLETQIKWSLKYDLPLIIHMRDATELTYETLKKYAPLKGIMHCYSGSKEMVEKFIDLGLHISLGGPVTFKNAKVPKEVAKIVPRDRLLVETDAPYLSPHPFRGKTNEPARVVLVAQKIAELREEPFEEVAAYTRQNALNLFQIEE